MQQAIDRPDGIIMSTSLSSCQGLGYWFDGVGVRRDDDTNNQHGNH
jgi:hypothetical protein